MRFCNQKLYGNKNLVARCLQVFGTEHSHHDYTAEEAVSKGIAKACRQYVKQISGHICKNPITTTYKNRTGIA